MTCFLIRLISQRNASLGDLIIYAYDSELRLSCPYQCYIWQKLQPAEEGIRSCKLNNLPVDGLALKEMRYRWLLKEHNEEFGVWRVLLRLMAMVVIAKSRQLLRKAHNSRQSMELLGGHLESPSRQSSGTSETPQMFSGFSNPIPQCRGQSGST